MLVELLELLQAALPHLGNTCTGAAGHTAAAEHMLDAACGALPGLCSGSCQLFAADLTAEFQQFRWVVGGERERLAARTHLQSKVLTGPKTLRRVVEEPTPASHHSLALGRSYMASTLCWQLPSLQDRLTRLNSRWEV